MAINLEILAYEETPLGPLCLRRRELLSDPGTIVTEVTLNHEFLMSSYNTDSERAISNRAIDIHGGKSLRALVGGLGLGYTARELLNSPNISFVEVFEYLPEVIDWLRSGLVPLSAELNQSDQLKITQGDVYQYLLGPPISHASCGVSGEGPGRDSSGSSRDNRFDLIVIDVDHSPDDRLGENENAFYTREGISKAKCHLQEGGVLAVWSYAESSAFAEALRDEFSHVKCEPIKTVNTLVGHEQTDWLFFAFNERD